MSTKPYPSYKDSGVEWLGRIPAQWGVRTLKHSATFFGGGTPSKDNPAFWTGDIPWVFPKDMKDETVNDSEDHITRDAILASATRMIPPDSVLLVVRSGILKHTVPVAINSRPVALNQDMKAVVPKTGLNSRYLAWFFRGQQRTLLLEWRKAGATVESLEHELIARTRIPCPADDEQQAIASFLDRETGKIDALVKKKERLIELLQEKRTALISHAVTQGLDPNTPKKDSGIPWVGHIPKHWELVPLGHMLVRITYGFTNPMPVVNDGPFMLTANDIGDGEILFDSARKTSQEAFDKSLTDKSRPRKGDILITKDGTLGRVAVADSKPICINQSVAMLRPKTEIVSLEFLQNALRAQAYQDCMVFNAGGTTIKHIYITRLAKMMIALPSLGEQGEVCSFVNEQRARLDALMAKVQTAIERLQEYRTALISAAVTGQIDVRHCKTEVAA